MSRIFLKKVIEKTRRLSVWVDGEAYSFFERLDKKELFSYNIRAFGLDYSRVEVATDTRRRG